MSPPSWLTATKYCAPVPRVARVTAGFVTGVTQQSYAYGPYTGYYYKATGVTDDFPTLHADQPQFGAGFLNVENVLGDGTDLLGYACRDYSVDAATDCCGSRVMELCWA